GEVRTAAVAAAGPVTTAAAAPGIISRAEWGAAPQACEFDVASTLLAAVVHHTAGPNSYASVDQAKAQIRADQRYHQQSRGWCDIGYNYLVDKWGNVYEGRAGSGTRPVIGVHAGGFNTATLGVSMLGDYSSGTPSAAVQENVARLIAWRLGSYHRDPTSTISYTTLGGENSRFAGGTTLALPVVIGHRDVAYTACPGNGGYAVLGTIKQRAKEMIGGTLVNPRLSTQQVAYGSGLEVVAGVSYGLAWDLTVTDVRSGVDVARRSGSTGPSTGAGVIGFDGRSDAGVPLGTGDYRLTVRGHDLVTGAPMVPWSAAFAVTGSQSPPTVAPVPLVGNLRFVPVTPARLLDTRSTGASLGPASRVDVAVTGRAGIPADARAVALNVTTVHSSGITHVRAWPAGAPVPDASVTNTDAQRVSAATTIVGVGGEGKVSLWNSAGSTHLLVDVSGYFVDGSTGSGFAAAATPARLLETRTDGGEIAGGTRRTLQVAGRAGVPTDATAVVLNVTTHAGAAGYTAVVPRGAAAGVVSTVNHQPNRDVANRAVVPLNGGGVDVEVAGAGAHVVVDVVGWFSPAASARYTPVVPVRAFDTRSGSPLGAAADRRFDLTPVGVPADARAVALNLTSTRATSFATYLTTWGGGTRPGTSDLNTGAGRDQANLAVVAPAGGGLRVYNNLGSTHVVGDVLGWFR
ncbi:peptidoglycan recognition protein, partial [Cellulomonas sp. 179-A 9B4 NHS]|uniref:peptidoglycan recognition protein family protein n=1 Tax=Cellulomonas sp. 179-A 9B4 NHS TaxID=3142379 RepID=UPI00399FC018